MRELRRKKRALRRSYLWLKLGRPGIAWSELCGKRAKAALLVAKGGAQHD